LSDGTLATLRREYGAERRVIVDFAAAPQLAATHLALVTARDGNRLTFGVASSATAALLAQLTAEHAVHDLVVEHPPIEEVIARVYEDGRG
jgi:ABC-2 type transport system ATP-binding protein